MVATVPLETYSAPAIERGLRDLAWVSGCAVGHEAVVEACLAGGTILPARLFTIFRSDDSAVAHVVRGRKRILGLLERVAGSREWSVRVKLDRLPKPERAGRAETGRQYLTRKREQHARRAVESRRTRAEAQKVHRRLARAAREARRRSAVQLAGTDDRLLLDAVYLVSTAGAPTFRRIARQCGQDLAREGCTLVLTGPWPPYNFVGSVRPPA
jgi:hypothetical protein